MDDALKNASTRLDAIAAEINKKMQEVEDLRREKARIQQFINDWYVFSGKEPPGVDSESSQAVENPARMRATGNPKKEIVARVAREIITQAGVPVARGALFNALRDRGIEIHGADAEKTFSTMLWRMMDAECLIHLRNHGYWLRERPFEPAGYTPDPKAMYITAHYD